MATEKEDLDQLVRSDGWLRLKQRMTEEWGAERVVRDVFRALGDVDGVIAIDKARQVAAAAKAVKAVIDWPDERLKELERAEQSREKETAVPLSRRGSL